MRRGLFAADLVKPHAHARRSLSCRLARLFAASTDRSHNRNGTVAGAPTVNPAAPGVDLSRCDGITAPVAAGSPGFIARTTRGVVNGGGGASNSDNGRGLLTRLIRDQAGIQLILVAVLMPVLIGIAALAVDLGLWGYNQLTLQAAANSAAASAAVANSKNSSANISLEAEATAAGLVNQSGRYGFVNGQNSVNVYAYNPPQVTPNVASGNCSLAANDPYIVGSLAPFAFEVIVTQQQAPFFSSIFGFPNSVTLCGRAVALQTGGGCMLALDPTEAGAITASGGASITFQGCGMFSDSDASGGSSKKTCNDSICLSGSAAIKLCPEAGCGTSGKITGTVGTVGLVSLTGGATITTPPGYTTNDSPIANPYADVSFPSSSSATYSAQTCGTTTTSPFHGSPAGHNITLTSASVVNPGVYCGVITVSGTPTFNGGAGPYAFQDGFHVTSGNPTLPALSSGTYTFQNGISITGGQLTTGSGTYNIFGGISVGSGGLTTSTGTYTIYGGIAVSGGTLTMNPGSDTYTIYSAATSGAIAVSGTGNVALNSGIYILNSTSSNASATTLTVGNSGTLTGTNATLAFTSSTDTYPATMMQFSGAAVVNLTAPTTGATSGMVIFGDSTMPVGTQFLVSNGATLNFTGAIDVPKAAFTFSGGTSTTSPCAQFVADTINLTGSGSFQNNCVGTPGIKLIGASATLVE